jgi:predicted small lipoprotein YifL
VKNYLALAALTAVAAVGIVGPLAVPSTASAAVASKRCAWWNLEGKTDTDLVIDALGGKTTCKAAKAVGDAYLKARGWHPVKLRAAGKTWHRIAQEDHNGGDDCANGDTPLGGGPYSSYKTTQYEARTRYGWQSVYLTYQWVLEDQEYCSGT